MAGSDPARHGTARHGRMSESPFAFYRGAAKIMAADLGTTPATGPIAQICGDAASQK